jgi:NAD(P)-dependent dehydrogenase (short-subunit alcohol dehydrogenase family)
MVETAVGSFGGLDVLHNNASDAGTNALDMDVVTLDMAVFDGLVAVNLKSQFMGCDCLHAQRTVHRRPVMLRLAVSHASVRKSR